MQLDAPIAEVCNRSLVRSPSLLGNKFGKRSKSFATEGIRNLEILSPKVHLPDIFLLPTMVKYQNIN